MTIEAKNNEEGQKTNVIKESDISPKNTEALGKDLSSLETVDPEAFKLLMGKLNYWDEGKAGPTDLLKGIMVKNSIGGDMSKAETVERIISLKIISTEDIKTLSPQKLNEKIQQVMFERIQQTPRAKKRLDEYLTIKGLPNDGLIDGKFGPRSLLMMQIIIEIPPVEEPKVPPVEKPKEELPDIITYEPKYTINVRGDAADGAYYFVNTEAEYLDFVNRNPIFSSAVIQSKDNTQEQEHLGVTINSSKDVFAERIKNYQNLSNVLGPFKRISDTKEKQQVLRAAGKLRKDDFGNMIPDKVDNRHIFKHEKSKQYTIVRAQ